MSITIKAKLRPSVSPNQAATITYRVCIRRRTATVSSGIRITPEQWNPISERLNIPDETAPEKRERTLQLNECIRNDLKRLAEIAADLQQTAPHTITAHEVCARFRQTDTYPGFLHFMKQEIERLTSEKHFSTAEKYHTARQHLCRFLQNADIRIDNLSAQMMLRFEKHLYANGICPNSSSAYMRCLSAVYHRAISTFGLPDTHPFKPVFTGVAGTQKRAIPQRILQKIIEMNTPQDTKTALARDIFLFSFYTRGMSLIDILFLRKENISGDTLCYRRRKTGQWLHIRLEPCMKEILKRYAQKTEPTPHLFPIITTDMPEAAYVQYRHYLAAYNYQLRKIGKTLKLGMPLTGYVARHTWATTARDSGISTPIISACLGHTSERTTLIYLDSLDNNLLDRANRKIIGKLKNKKFTALRKSGE